MTTTNALIQKIATATLAINKGAAYTVFTGDDLKEYIGEDDNNNVVGFIGDNGSNAFLTEKELAQCETDECSLYVPGEGRFVLFRASYVNL